ncbi:hypothetical protein ACOME3_003542 [Neoechinorhynchus agilis]
MFSDLGSGSCLPIIRSRSVDLKHAVRLKRVELGVYKENLCAQIKEIEDAMINRELIDESMLGEAIKRIQVLCTAFAQTLEECLEQLDSFKTPND